MKKIFRHPKAEELHIKRVPKQTKERFIEFADGFCGDYGMALKQLIDFTLSFGPMVDGVHAAISEMNMRIEQIEQGPKQEEKKEEPKKTLGGRIIGSGGNRK